MIRPFDDDELRIANEWDQYFRRRVALDPLDETVDRATTASAQRDLALTCLDLLADLAQTRRKDKTLAEAPATPRRIAHFEIRERLGAGGFGIVYLAFDLRTRREVALKIPRLETFATDELRQRFEHEAMAAARLDHPHIVPVLEAGVDGLMPYIAMAYCPSETLARWLRDWAKPVDVARVASLAHKLALALAHAHERGVLHRDVKPNNILLTPPQGLETIDSLDALDFPRLMDFGLAKLAEGSVNFTRSGALLGTVQYMSPEQAEGRTKQISVASDVYSLGAVLYEMLVGHPPFRADSEAAVLLAIAKDEPIAPRRHRPDIPKDLEVICLKCLEKAPERRYPSARALAEDLDRFLAGEPTLARPLAWRDRATRWVRRYPTAAALIAVSFAAIISIVAGTIWFNARLGAALGEAQSSARQSREFAYSATVRLAQEAWDRSSPQEAKELLDRFIPAPGEPDIRGPEWFFLSDAMRRYSDIVAQQDKPVWSLAVSPDQKQFATGDTEGTIRIWKLDPPRLEREIPGHAGHIDALVYSSDGKTLISGGNDNSIRIWRIADGSKLHDLRDHDSWIAALALLPDGKRLVSGDGKGSIKIRDVAAPEQPKELYQHDDYVRWIAVNPSRPWFVTAANSGDIRIWNYVTLGPPAERPDGRLNGPSHPTWRDGVFESNGESLWTANKGALLRWNFLTPGDWNREPHHFSRGDKVMALAIVGADDFLIVGGSSPPVVRVHRLAKTVPLVKSLRGHSGSIRRMVALDKARNEFLSAADDGAVRRWNIRSRDIDCVRVDLPETPQAVTWLSPSGVVAVALDGQRVWTLSASGEFQGDFPRKASPTVKDDWLVRRVAISGDGERLLAVLRSGETWLAPTKAGGQALHRLGYRLCRDIGPMVIGGDGRRASYIDHDHVINIDMESGAEQWRVEHPGGAWDLLAVSGDSLLSAAGDGIIRRIDALTGEVVQQSRRLVASINRIGLSSDGRFLVGAMDGQKAIIWDVATLEQLSTFSIPIEATFIDFIDQDRRLLAWDEEKVIVVNSETGQTLLHIEPEFSLRAAVSPDGATLVTIEDKSVVYWPLTRRTPP